MDEDRRPHEDRAPTEDAGGEGVGGEDAGGGGAAGERAGGSTAAWRAVAAWAGPALIVAAVLVVMRDFAFGGKLTSQHVDILSFWLPNHCYLGRALAEGAIPTWNPTTMAGAPFAADPQSGWMYLPVMVLYSALPCHVAAGWFIVLNPILAGLGVYAFLRAERLSRPAATTGGLVLALVLAGSTLSLELPFAGSIGWSALLLAGAARYLGAVSWAGRLAWAAAAGAAWSQVAAAHLSHGLFIGTGLLVMYVAAKLGHAVRTRSMDWRGALLHGGLLFVALPLVSLAYLWPRLFFLPRSTIGEGYRRLSDLTPELIGSGERPPAWATGGLVPTWPSQLIVSPGPYLGAVASVLSPAGWWDRSRRHLFLALGLFGLACYLASLRTVADFLAPRIGSWPLADFYFHAPGRLRLGLVLVLPILAGLGLAAWRGEPSSRRRVLMLLPGVAVWWVFPIASGLQRPSPWLLAVGILVGGAVLLAGHVRPAVGWAVPAVVAAELLANGLLGQDPGYAPSRPASGGAQTFLPQVAGLGPLRRADIDGAAYLSPTATADAIGDLQDRYLTLGPRGVRRGVRLKDPRYWVFLGNQRSTLFDLADVEGYNPSQLRRYWRFVRVIEGKPLKYNAAFFTVPDGVMLDLLRVGWVISDVGDPPPTPDAPLVTRDGLAQLHRIPDVPPLVTVFGTWQVVDSEEAAQSIVASSGFDPTATAILETQPVVDGAVAIPSPVAPAARPGSTVVSTGPGSTRITVSTSSAAVVLVRIPFDAGWHATVDGEEAEVLPADYVVQAVVVGPGEHIVELAFLDPAIGHGMVGTAAVLALLLGGAVALRRRGGTMP